MYRDSSVELRHNFMKTTQNYRLLVRDSEADHKNYLVHLPSLQMHLLLQATQNCEINILAIALMGKHRPKVLLFHRSNICCSLILARLHDVITSP